jgi:DNA-binding NarL/FixJ family response regulator
MSPKTRVLVIDDHPFFRSGIIRWLNQQSDLVCCGEAESVATARCMVAEVQPDIVLLDLRLPDGDGLDLLREFSQLQPPVRSIVLSQNDDFVFAHRALRSGARGYVMKSAAEDTILSAIRTVLEGKVWVSRPVAAGLLENLFPDPHNTNRSLSALSDRELQVFQLLGARLSTREIAQRLRISPKTVETYRENLKTKLGFGNSDLLVKSARNWVEHGRL